MSDFRPDARQACLLAELVRLLHERGHVFDTDPDALTAALAQSPEPPGQRLLQRAAMLDRDGTLARSLAAVEQRARLLRHLLTAAAAIGGFGAVTALMQQSGLNFFLLLVGVLGMNGLMFALWLVSLYGLRRTGGAPWLPGWLFRSGGSLRQVLAELYAAQWRTPAARWQAGALTHRLWTASLGGMLAAVVLLLSVRQYTFNWESTWLSDHSFVQAVAVLSWLPQQLGFPVPDSGAVLGSRLNHSIAGAREWGGLLAGSLLCYGLLPRLAAWAFCRWRAGRLPPRLPIDLPYYRQVLRVWQRRVVDGAADYRADAPPPPVLPAAAAAEHWAVMLERPWHDAFWHRHVLGRRWHDYGTADSREAVAELLAELSGRPVQLLLGIRAQSLPDRGLLRQVDKLAQAAQGGAAVQLLAEPDSGTEAVAESVRQWQEALQARGMICLNPPQWAQQAFR